MLLTAACSRDLGNYDYVDLKEPAVTGLEDMAVLTFAHLSIAPEIAGGEYPDSEYSFEWSTARINARHKKRQSVCALLFFMLKRLASPRV